MSWIIVLVWFAVLGYQCWRHHCLSHVINAVEPEEIPGNLSVPILVTGNGFEADAQAVLDGKIALPQITWINEHTIKVVVPEGLAPGTHTLTVDNPGHGDHITLADALFVQRVTVI